MIWLVFALLTGAAVMSVLWPLARRGEAADPATTDIAFFEEQIAEIDRETNEGRLSPQDRETARAEAARRLLRARAALGGDAKASRRNAVVAAAFAIVVVPALALFVYSRLGHSDLPDLPLQARLEAAPAHSDLASAVARIEAHLAEHPEDGRGYEVVAPFYLRNGRAADAIDAFAKALRLLGPTPHRHASLGEARVMAEKGRVSEEAQRDFEAALALDPKSAIARYYIGLAAAQNGERDKAIDIWSKLLADATPDAPWRERVAALLEQLRGAPAGEAGAKIAAMPQAAQQQAIRSMVERLRDRLEQNGDDVEGWLKLIRAYSVLDEAEKAKAALDGARKALANDMDGRARVDALARELGVGG
ncbi:MULTISPECIES: c-type cytochrome biogenesis protein CcmI [Methylosinus]|uniref:C-type cytochrome biogenesis protein CcmI n=1 Tax=Methylosinus trichosporium (strain ATCC 35070 / NCIMB 11131 / UNIQEM 75 / OB3b) TaxID=595536 RepID=A0A2D2D0A6_METT3|nr:MULTISPECIES: c-type cytochrome biogenesis protein CcmI [Methylosinus]ATQ68402.1 c-type cytochrome biogenesis protein CcmI [Methylosinus trichosporium OB3b]OBS51360.1 c-type cytochrome biogenesis protein CcmI [Methylosinus sp. 3S-1]